MMKRVVKDGWHKMYNFEVYVENGVVLYAILFNQRRYPYRWSNKLCCWCNESGYNSLEAVRAGYSRDSIDFK